MSELDASCNANQKNVDGIVIIIIDSQIVRVEYCDKGKQRKWALRFYRFNLGKDFIFLNFLS